MARLVSTERGGGRGVSDLCAAHLAVDVEVLSSLGIDHHSTPMCVECFQVRVRHHGDRCQWCETEARR